MPNMVMTVTPSRTGDHLRSRFQDLASNDIPVLHITLVDARTLTVISTTDRANGTTRVIDHRVGGIALPGERPVMAGCGAGQVTKQCADRGVPIAYANPLRVPEPRSPQRSETYDVAW